MLERAQEYATDDRLYNFKRAARITGSSLPDAVKGMMMKHLVSVLDMAEMRRDFNKDQLDEKFTDLHNYLFFLEIAIHLEKEEEAQRILAKQALDTAAKKAAQKYQEVADATAKDAD